MKGKDSVGPGLHATYSSNGLALVLETDWYPCSLCSKNKFAVEF